MNDSPSISVVILNYNRREILRECIQSALRLDWPNLEWIVVDNASEDGSADMVAREFGSKVKLIRRTVNSVTAGRNEGFQAAQGRYILSLDNDILLPDPAILQKGVRIFDRFPSAGLLSFKIGDPQNPQRFLKEHWWHPVPFDEGENRFFYTSYFPEAAALIRKEAVDMTGGYDEDFFMGVEQADFGLKLLSSGFFMLYCPNLSAVEKVVRGQLASKKSRIHYLNMRNKLWIAWKHYPFLRALSYSAGRIAASGIRSLRNGWFGYFLQGVRDGIFAPKKIRSKRDPLPAPVWQSFDQIQNGWFLDETPE